MAAKLNAGIIGLGRAGWANHVVPLADHPWMRVAAVADGMADRVREAIDLTGCKGYDNYQDLLADPEVDLVIVATPSHTHAAVTIEALQAGKHVVVEKPMATSLAEADAMIAAAREAGKVLTVFQNRRIDPEYLKVKEWLESGRLGNVSLIRIGRYMYSRRNDWQTLRKYGGGMLNNWGPHIIDWALQLAPDARLAFADMKQTVSAGDAEDHVHIVLKGSTGTVVEVEIVQDYAFPAPTWIVMGSHGSITCDGRVMTLKWCDPAKLMDLVAEEGPVPGRKYGTGEVVEWMEESFTLPANPSQPAEWYRILYNSLVEGAPLLVTPESIRRQMELFEEIRQMSGF